MIHQMSHMEIPEKDDKTRENLITAIYVERGKFIEPHAFTHYDDVESEIEKQNDIPETVVSESAINNGYCKVFAQRVYKRLGQPEDVILKSDEHRHTWVEYDGLCYDAESPHGVSHPRLLPVYARMKVF